MTAVVDASTVVAALIDSGPTGTWAESILMAGPVAAPHLMPIEATNILRRSVASGEVAADVAALAHADLNALHVEYFPYRPLASRVWELRNNLTAYDAWYVALAETLGTSLATLDFRLARASGPQCAFALPPDTVS